MLSAAAVVLQVVGLVLGAWGVHEVRQSLTGATSRTKAWMKARVQQARRWLCQSLADAWNRLRRRPITRTVSANLTATAHLSGTATITVGPRPIDPDAVTDREWLALLTEQFQGVYGHINTLRDQQAVDREVAAQQVQSAVSGLDASQRADAHRGLSWVYAGLIFTLIGTVLGGFA